MSLFPPPAPPRSVLSFPTIRVRSLSGTWHVAASTMQGGAIVACGAGTHVGDVRILRCDVFSTKPLEGGETLCPACFARETGRVVNVRALGVDAVRVGRLEALGLVYVGRSVPSWGLSGSPFRNPYKLDDGADEAARSQVLDAFRVHLRGRPDLVEKARRLLVGKGLACWCAPLPCHAEVLARVAAGGAP